MKNIGLILLGVIGSLLCNKVDEAVNVQNNNFIKSSQTNNAVHLGAFSISLNVKNLIESKIFYEKLGFTVLGGSLENKYLIMKNGNALIGLFQGMFTGNIMTFNPGWDENGQNVEPYDDVRKIQQSLKSKNVKLSLETDENLTGPGSIMTSDPDGNLILIDQHR
jgi:hypothetical protein